MTKQIYAVRSGGGWIVNPATLELVATHLGVLDPDVYRFSGIKSAGKCVKAIRDNGFHAEAVFISPLEPTDDTHSKGSP